MHSFESIEIAQELWLVLVVTLVVPLDVVLCWEVLPVLFFFLYPFLAMVGNGLIQINVR